MGGGIVVPDRAAADIQIDRRALLRVAPAVPASLGLVPLGLPGGHVAASEKPKRIDTDNRRNDREQGLAAEHYTLPIVPLKQQNGGFCGRTCAAMVLQYNGWNVQPSQLTTIPEWSNILDLADGIIDYTNGSLQAYWWLADAGSWFYDLEYETDDFRQPMIVLVPNGTKLGHDFDRAHFVVVRGTAAKTVRIRTRKGRRPRRRTNYYVRYADPADGNLWISSAAYFKAAWGAPRNPQGDAGPWQGLYFR